MSQIILHFYGLTGPTSQFLNGPHEFSDLVLARMALLMDQSRSVLPLQSAKARKLGELWRENRTRAPWTFPLNWPEPVLLGRPERAHGKWLWLLRLCSDLLELTNRETPDFIPFSLVLTDSLESLDNVNATVMELISLGTSLEAELQALRANLSKARDLCVKDSGTVSAGLCDRIPQERSVNAVADFRKVNVKVNETKLNGKRDV